MALGWSLTPPTVPQCDLECHQLQGSGKEVVGRNKIDAEDHDLSVSFDHCNTLIMLITALRVYSEFAQASGSLGVVRESHRYL